MAKQSGPIKIEGTLGDISFYKQNGKHFVRNKGGVSAERIKKDPRFARTRENLAEFGAANTGTKLMRKAFRLGIQKVRDNRLSNRLMPVLMKVLHADTTHLRGQRIISSGNLDLLSHFQFSRKVAFDAAYFLDPIITVDKSAGTAKVSWQEFSPMIDVVEQPESTHLRLFSVVAAIDFDLMKVESSMEISTEIGVVPTLSPSFEHEFTFTADTGLPLFVLLGLEFVQELNGVYYPLKNGTYNAMELYHIET